MKTTSIAGVISIIFLALTISLVSCSHDGPGSGSEGVENPQLPVDEWDPIAFQWWEPLTEYAMTRYFTFDSDSSVKVEIDYDDASDEWLEIECSDHVSMRPKSPCLDHARGANLKMTTKHKICKVRVIQAMMTENDDISPLIPNLSECLRSQGYSVGDSIYPRDLRDVKRLDGVALPEGELLKLFPALEYLRANVLNGIVDISHVQYLDTCNLYTDIKGVVTNIHCAANLTCLHLWRFNALEPKFDLTANSELVDVYLAQGDMKAVVLPQSVKSLNLEGNLSLESVELSQNLCNMSCYALPSLRYIDISKTQIGLTDISVPLCLRDVGGTDGAFPIFISREQLEAFNQYKWLIEFKANSDNPDYATSYQLKIAGHETVAPKFTMDIDGTGITSARVYFNFSDNGNEKITEMWGRCATTPWNDSMPGPGNGSFTTAAEELWRDSETLVWGCNFRNLSPGETYYVRLGVRTETGMAYVSEEQCITMGIYEEPRCHISLIEPTHDGANVTFVVDAAGNPTYSSYKVLVGLAPDVVEGNAVYDSGKSSSWPTKVGSERTTKVTGLESENRYYARIMMYWRDMVIYSDPMEFSTARAPDYPTSFLWDRCSYGTNQTTNTTSGWRFNVWFNLVAYFDRYDSGDEFYFETTAVIGNLMPTSIDTELGYMIFADTDYTFYYYSEPYRKPTFQIRAVVKKADGREYHSDWKDISFGLK